MIALSKRLSMVAGMVIGGSSCVDIGTDHAYLPVYLVQKGVIDSCIASDICAGPLKNAKKTIQRYGLSDKITLRLTPGLSGFTADECNEIIIAGMGGTVIAEILESAPFIKNESIHLILQPQSHSVDVRRWLCKNGFSIEYECVCEDSGRIYNAISAYFSHDMSKSENEGYFHIGELPYINDSKAEFLIEKCLCVIKNRIAGLEQCGRNGEELQSLQLALAQISDFYKKEKE